MALPDFIRQWRALLTLTALEGHGLQALLLLRHRDEDALYDAEELEDVAYAWRLRLRIAAGDAQVERWSGSDSEKSEESLVDDTPGLDPVPLPGTGPVRFVLDARLALHTEHTTEAVRWTGELTLEAPTSGQYEVLLTEVPALSDPPFEPIAPIDTLEVFPGPALPEGRSYFQVIPGVGVLERDGATWKLTSPAGTRTLSCLPEPGQLECITPGPLGRMAAVWQIERAGQYEGWHIGIYDLLLDKRLHWRAPEPKSNGNTPIPGVFDPSGRWLVCPLVYGGLGALEAETGHVLSRFTFQDLRALFVHVVFPQMWTAGRGALTCWNLETGERVWSRHIPDPYPHSGDRAVAYHPGCDRLAWTELLSGDPPESAVGWQDGDGSEGQVLLPGRVTGLEVLSDGRILTWGAKTYLVACGVVREVSAPDAGEHCRLSRVGERWRIWQSSGAWYVDFD